MRVTQQRFLAVVRGSLDNDFMSTSNDYLCISATISSSGSQSVDNDFMFTNNDYVCASATISSSGSNVT